jgi:predicted SAM-dependent methyltransferase
LINAYQKEFVYFLLSKVSIPNYCRYFLQNILFKPSKDKRMYLHLCNGSVYLKGFINIDINFFHKIDVWLDIRRGLPFRKKSVSGIYMVNSVEHFYLKDIEMIFRECGRVLNQDGILRIVVPSLELAIEAYSKNRLDAFSGFPGNFQTPGGRFSSAILCDGQHKNAYDFAFLKEILSRAGFSMIEKKEAFSSLIFTDEQAEDIRRLEYESSGYLFVEASL